MIDMAPLTITRLRKMIFVQNMNCPIGFDISLYKIHESLKLSNNSPDMSQMFTLNAFKPSSGICQDYANSKSLIVATVVK